MSRMVVRWCLPYKIPDFQLVYPFGRCYGYSLYMSILYHHFPPVPCLMGPSRQAPVVPRASQRSVVEGAGARPGFCGETNSRNQYKLENLVVSILSIDVLQNFWRFSSGCWLQQVFHDLSCSFTVYSDHFARNGCIAPEEFWRAGPFLEGSWVF